MVWIWEGGKVERIWEELEEGKSWSEYFVQKLLSIKNGGIYRKQGMGDKNMRERDGWAGGKTQWESNERDILIKGDIMG